VISVERRKRRTWAVAAASGCAVLLVLSAFLWVEDPAAFRVLGLDGASGPAVNGTVNESYDIQSYTSSVDGTALWYYEWLPLGYQASHSYPFLLYLHGKGYQGGQVFNTIGGVSAVNAAISHGFIVGALETRSEGGFYLNSVYTGPQQQDVLDAIAHEKSVRAVSSVWLFGFSMGTMGAFALAEHYPGLISGIGVIGSCPDLYQVEAYKISVGEQSDFNFWLQVTGGSLANQSAYADGLTYYISAFRFFPQNLSGVRLYVSEGGNDRNCPDDPEIYPFEQGNDTVLDSSCLVATSLDEPANCTTPYAALAAKDPSQFQYRYVYDPNGSHTLDLLDGSDMIGFFLGQEPTGSYLSPGLGGTPYAPPA
jgi:pimeloyl-ACP methyl ester carboxylesterase